MRFGAVFLAGKKVFVDGLPEFNLKSVHIGCFESGNRIRAAIDNPPVEASYGIVEFDCSRVTFVCHLFFRIMWFFIFDTPSHPIAEASFCSSPNYSAMFVGRAFNESHMLYFNILRNSSAEFSHVRFAC